MSDLRDLYQQLVLDHGRHPRNRRAMDSCDCGDGAQCCHTDGYNPLCGDKLTLYARVRDDVIEDLSFEGEGCAIFTASTSMLTEVLKGRRVSEIRGILDEFLDLLTSGEKVPDPDGLGKLAVFGGVKDFPTRVKCATLPWRALEVILENVDHEAAAEKPVSTEDG